jgi:cell division protease FtsH
MPLPTLKAREQIFRIHFKDKPVAQDVDFELLAHQTEGRTGADIAAFANEASYRLFEARLRNKRVKQITMDIMEDIIRRPHARAHVGGYA